MDNVPQGFPATLDIDYPDRMLDRLTTFFRPFTVIPIAVILALLTKAAVHAGSTSHVVGSGGIVFLATVLMLDAQVAAMHAASRGSYGRPRIVRGLREQGLRVGPERVRRSLQRQALRPVYKRPYRVTTDSDHRLPVAPNVLARQFDGWDLNRAWVADITYVSTIEGWLYLAVVMDLASRRIVGWSMCERLHADLVCQALHAAYWRRKPAPGLILHSDRGSQYASARYRKLIGDYRMRQSMSRKADCWDTQSRMTLNARSNLTRAGIG